MKLKTRSEYRKRRHQRLRKKVIGTTRRPRMCVSVSNKHMYVQLVDDVAAATLAAVSTVSKTIPDREKVKANVTTAKQVGALAAAAAKEKGIQQVVFDRAGARYHGKVKALADAAREAGLIF